MPGSTPPPSLLHSMLRLRPVPRSRLAFSMRAAAAMGAPVLAGWLAGDVQAGLMAATGGFTSLYGRGRPYPARGLELGAIALAFALSVGVGSAVGAVPWALVPVVAAIAMLSTWLGNALRIGPPGAYMFMLACAAAASMPAGHISPAEAAALVLAGGGFAWLLQMAPVLWDPRGPERRTVAGAAAAVARFLDEGDGPQAGRLRQRAAQALHEAWHALVRYQPARSAPDGELALLRERTQRLAGLFADAMAVRADGGTVPDGVAAQARVLDAPTAPLPRPERRGHTDRLALGQPGLGPMLRESLRMRSMSMLVVARVGVAALLAVALAAALELERAYWAIAAAVLMLHQGLGWRPTLQRSLERTLGTWIGLLVAGAVLAWHPQGLWLVGTIAVLQFTVEMLVMRNYSLAAVFITAAGLVLAAGGRPVDDLGGYLLARGVDTVVGCVVALLVFRMMWPRATAALVPVQLRRTFAAIGTLGACLQRGAAGSGEGQRAMRELQHRSFALVAAYDTAVAATRDPHPLAERAWPVVAATEELAYRLMGACWAEGGTREDQGEGGVLDRAGLQALEAALEDAAHAVAERTPPAPVAGVPGFLAAEVDRLRRALRAAFE